MDELIAMAWQAEEALLTPGVRTNAEQVAELLAPEFYEIGQSGRRWGRQEIIDHLASESAPVSAAVVTEREARLLGPDIVLLSYRCEFGSAHSRRSSLWRRHSGAVVCLFHQGTPVPPHLPLGNLVTPAV